MLRPVLIVALLLGGSFCTAQEPGQDDNVNCKYVIESVDVVGIDASHLSPTVRDDLKVLVGQQFDEGKLNRIFNRLRRDFPEYTITRKVSRGDQPDHVKIVFELKLGQRRGRFDMSINRGLYSSRLGWTGDWATTIRASTSEFTFRLVSDGDKLLERFAGIGARYENRSLGTDRLHLAFDFESYHTIWNGATLRAGADGPGDLGIYRNRQNFQPTLTFIPVRGLSLTAGTSFERFQKQYPAAHTEAANAVVGTLRYDRQLESSGPNTHRLGAGYSLRAATKTLDSDYVYTRHAWDFVYALWHGAHKLSVHTTAGLISGVAPLFERFVLGNSSTLRGWNKYDLAPLGGDRVVHNSVDYRYRAFRVFYDTGAVWQHGQEASAKHSAGAGLQFGDFAFLVGFPIRSGHAEPIFMVGLNL